MNTGFKIGKANVDEQPESGDNAYYAAQEAWERSSITSRDASADPVTMGKKRHDYSFIDAFLLERVKEKMQTMEQFKDQPFFDMMAATTVSCLRSAVNTMLGVSGTFDMQNVRDMKFKFPNELNIVIRANALRNEGKTDEQVLAALRAENK